MSKSRKRNTPTNELRLPDYDVLRQKLPKFEPYDMRQLLTDARKLMREQKVTLDEAAVLALDKRRRSQVLELVKALGLDPTSKNFWADAFLKLAGIHHNVGQVRHQQQRPRPKNARTWTTRDEPRCSLEWWP